jgi:hypothetical protein
LALGSVLAPVILLRTVISRSQERDILKQYEAILGSEREAYAAEEARLLERRSGVERLAAIVENLAERLGVEAQAERVEVPAAERPPAPAAPRAPGSADAGLTIRHGRPTLTSVIRQILADGGARNADAVLAEIERRGDETAAQGTKQQIGNRLVELRKQGYLEPLERGVYQLASAEAKRNDAGRESPLLPVQPGVQKPPGEELISPRPGHSHNVEGAPGVGYRAGV